MAEAEEIELENLPPPQSSSVSSTSLLSSDISVDGPQKDLIQYIEENNIEEIKNLKDKNVDFNYKYHDKTPLLLACTTYKENITRPCIELLLIYGADPLDTDKNGINCVKWAAASGNINILEPILLYLKEGKYDFEADGTMLFLMNHINTVLSSNNHNEEYYFEVTELLLKYIDINKTDDDTEQTVIYKAANYGLKDIVNLIIYKKQESINLFTYKDGNGKTAWDIIAEKEMFDELLLIDYMGYTETEISLLESITKSGFEEFRQIYQDRCSSITEQQKKDLFHLCVENGYHECVKFLLDINPTTHLGTFTDRQITDRQITDCSSPTADHRQTTNKGLSAIEKAGLKGYYKIIKLLLEANTKPSILDIHKCLIAVTNYHGGVVKDHDHNFDYEECFNLLLNYEDIKVNYKDKVLTKTALHLSAMYQPSEMTLKLLNKGASLACKDDGGVMPIADMDADTLQAHLDECLIESDQNVALDDENRYITIKVSSLLLPRPDTLLTEDTTTTNANNENCTLLLETPSVIEKLTEYIQETTVLRYMADSQELKHLLIHPVILTFLYLKWFHIRRIFHINLAIYATFFASLLLYVLLSCNDLKETEYPTLSKINRVSYLILLLTFLILSFREIAQIVLYNYKYAKNFENWIEVTLLIFIAIILVKNPDEDLVRSLSALSIVLSAIELLLLIGQFPSLSTNIVMLRKVSFTFFKLFLWYSVLLIAFAFSFYTLFHEEKKKNGDYKKNDNKSEPDEYENSDDEDPNFFLDPGISLLKTLVMLTGEFDTSSIKFAYYPITSHLIFVAFVFLIAIVLFNLLNGLAVSDTQLIKNNAVLYEQILKIGYFEYLENMILKYDFIRSWPYVSDICLFPSSVNDIEIYVNDNFRVVYGENEDSGQSEIYLEKKIQHEIKNLLHSNKVEEKRKYKEDEERKHLLKQLEDMKKKLDSLYARSTYYENINKVEEKLDSLYAFLINLNK